MRNQEDLPYILVERDSGGSFGSFCLGALVGAGLALLFAPQSGEETQEPPVVAAQELRAGRVSSLMEEERGHDRASWATTRSSKASTRSPIT